MIFNFRGIEGFDVSLYQDNNSTPQQIDFQKMKAWGADFVIIRAGQNVWTDPDFVNNWRRAREAGIPRAAYWFYDPRITPYEQARIFATLVRDDRPEGRLWVDLEFPSSWGGSFTGWQNWKTFIEETRRLSGLRIGIYTANWWWSTNAVQRGADTAYFGQYPLWVAQYTGSAANVTLPRGWSKAMIWQDGTPAIGPDVGVESIEVDHNQWNSDFDFATEWGGVVPPTGGSVFYKVIAGVLNIRSGPGVGYPDIGDLLNGDVIEVSQTMSGWHQLKAITRNGLAVGLPGASAWCSGGSQYVEEYTAPPPPVGNFPSEIGVTIGGVTKQYILK